MTPQEYKLLQEQSVTGHTGGNALEVHWITGHIIVPLGSLILEIAFLVVSSIVALCMHDLLPILAIIEVAIIALLLYLNGTPKYNKKLTPSYVVAFKAIVMMLTCMSILAVDFKLFPRRFAKTETIGVSVMDAGVGATVVGMGLSRGLGAAANRPNRWRFWPLLAIGLLRMAAVKLSGYQEHVGEYGVHWNFFLTLSVIMLVGNVVVRLIGGKRCGWFASIVLVFYEVLLSGFGLFKIVADNDVVRSNLILANKEGLSSCFGYLFLFLISVRIGFGLHSTTPSRASRHLLILSVLFYTTVYLLSTVLPVSRRAANSSYCLWVLALCTGHLSLLAHMDANSLCNSTVLERISRNQLAVFMTANVLTGVINKLIYTLLLSDLWAIMIMFTFGVTIFGVFCLQ